MPKVDDLLVIGRDADLVCAIEEITPQYTSAWVINGAWELLILPNGHMFTQKYGNEIKGRRYDLGPMVGYLDYNDLCRKSAIAIKWRHWRLPTVYRWISNVRALKKRVDKTIYAAKRAWYDDYNIIEDDIPF